MMTTGELIDFYAKGKNINLHKLATMSGVSYNTLYSIVRRKSNKVDMKTIEKVAKALEIFPQELLPLEDNYIEGLAGTQYCESSLTIEKAEDYGNGYGHLTIGVNLETVKLNDLVELLEFMTSRGFPPENLSELSAIIDNVKRESNNRKNREAIKDGGV